MTAVTKKSTRATEFGGLVNANGPEARGWLRLPWGIAAAAVLLVFFGMDSDRLVHAQAYSVLYNFKGAPSDGSGTSAGVIRDSLGTLYGTTTNGGASNDGTVYKLDASGNEIVLRSFAGGSDGAEPLYAGVVRDASGNLYGTTLAGGSSSAGTVFKVDPSGNETVLHSFSFNGSDGALPVVGLAIDSKGNLYGTTDAGGSSNAGTVFEVDSSGNETVLYSFTGSSDGAHPEAPLLLDTTGNLYGTTRDGGLGSNGTVFKVDPSGNETVLYSFTGGRDGGNPEAGVIMDRAGNLYGTTEIGGTSGNGTVFKLNKTGHEAVLHSFAGGSDGSAPFAGLVFDPVGNLYGTTQRGGSAGFGTVFKVDGSGKETVLHGFGSGSDGQTPYATLVLDSSGNLYGTTAYGGSSGNGTVFKLTLPMPF